MSSILTWIQITILTAAIMGCSNMGQKGDLSPFYEAAFDDKNRPPASLQPPSMASPSDTLIDPVYVRSQADYHFTLGESHSLDGHSKKAIEEFKLSLLYSVDSAIIHYRLAVEYMKVGLVGESIEQAEQALEKSPNYRDPRLLLGGIYTSLKMYDQAHEQYMAVIDAYPEDEEAPLFIGALLAEQKKFEEAAAHFENIGQNSKSEISYLAYYYLGRVVLEQYGEKGFKRAKAAFRKSLQKRPSHADSVLALASIYQKEKAEKKVVKLLASYQDKHGPDIRIAEMLASIYMEKDQFSPALEQFQIIESGDPDNVNAKVKVALLMIELKKYTAAIQKLEEILTVVPDADRIRFYLGAVYEEIKEYSLAIEQFSKVPVTSSFYVEAIVHESYLHKSLGDYDTAIRVVEAGIQNRDNVPQLYALYASLLDDQKEYEKAVEMLTVAISKVPGHAQLLFYLGSMTDKLGDLDGTISTMKKVLDIDSEHVRALNYLAYTYAENDLHLDQAEMMARKALDKQPGDAYIMDTLGWVLYKKGDLEEAVKFLETAHKAKITESIIAEHLGDAYHKYQLHQKARQMYRKAVETENNEDSRRKLRQKIARINEELNDLSRRPASASKPAKKTQKKSK